MKHLFILSLGLFITGAILAQAPTISIPNAKVTITQEEINQMGQGQSANRSIFVLNFEGLGNEDAVLEFYNGGTSSQGNSGPDYGVEFVGNTLSLIDADAGGGGNFANEPSPSTVMFFLTGTYAGMNVPAGFSTGFAFFYTANLGDGFVQVWSGLNGTGTMLASQTLPINWNVNCVGDPSGQFCRWDPIGVPFNGVAKSIYFGGVANHVGFDDITFGSTTPGYETPVSNWAIFIGIGLILMFAFFRAWRISRA